MLELAQKQKNTEAKEALEQCINHFSYSKIDLNKVENDIKIDEKEMKENFPQYETDVSQLCETYNSTYKKEFL